MKSTCVCCIGNATIHRNDLTQHAGTGEEVADMVELTNFAACLFDVFPASNIFRRFVFLDQSCNGFNKPGVVLARNYVTDSETEVSILKEGVDHKDLTSQHPDRLPLPELEPRRMWYEEMGHMCQ